MKEAARMDHLKPDGTLDASETWSHRLREPLPRRQLGPGILLLLWILRIYVMIAVPLVVYAFVTALRQGH
jgi:hypothetical protein